ncbi:MAG TPA: aminodeoxychorismate lyase, partial [Bacteroidetes bacterium]|nr:aminodeoxychorismate lyase [Bacteroidota bacterium]
LNNDALVNLLRSGKQEPVQLILQEVRKLPELALLFARQLEPDSAAFMHVFQEHEKVKEWGFNDTTIMTMFLPNTYEFYWNTSAGGTLERMYKEY